MTIYKYRINLSSILDLNLPEGSDILTLNLPEGSRVVCVGQQNEIVSFWVEQDPKQPLVRRIFRIVGTGETYYDYKHVGTVQIGAFDWHLVEKI